MDPNTALEYIRSICQQFNERATYADMDELVEQVQALDEFMSKGGFSPWNNDYGKLSSFSGRFSFNGTEYTVSEIEFEPADKFEEYDTLTVYAREQD